METMKQHLARCVADVYDGPAMFHRCFNKGIHLCKGKLYCGIHDPRKVEARKKKRAKKRKERDDLTWLILEEEETIQRCRFRIADIVLSRKLSKQSIEDQRLDLLVDQVINSRQKLIEFRARLEKLA